jgi:uncharacterized membrane protein
MDLVWPIVSGGIIVTIILIGVIMIWKIAREKKSGFPLKDERTQRVTGKAAIYALLLSQYFTLALLFVNFINQVFYDSPAFEVGYALLASLLASSLSFLILCFYFNRKGDS